MYHTFNHFSVDGHLDCFHVLAIVNGAVMNTVVCVSFRVFFSRYMHKSGIVESYGRTYRWLISTWKDAQHCQLLDKCQSKPQRNITSHWSEWPSSISLQAIMLERVWRKVNPTIPLVECELVQPLWKIMKLP